MDNSKNQKYDIDDILSEIKRKKLERDPNTISPAQEPSSPIVPRSSFRSSEESSTAEAIEKFSIKQSDESTTEPVFSRTENISAAEIPSEDKVADFNIAPSVSSDDKTEIFTPIVHQTEPNIAPQQNSVEFSIKTSEIPSNEDISNTRVTYFDDSVKASAGKNLLASDRQIKIDDTLHQYFGADAPSSSKKGTFSKSSKKSSHSSVDPTRHIDLSTYEEAKKNRIAQVEEINEATVSVLNTPAVKPEPQPIEDNSAKTQVLITPEPIEVPKPQEAEEDNPENNPPALIDEYVSPTQAKSILKDLENQKVSLIVRLALTALLFAGSLYLSLSAQLSSGLPASISFAENSVAFIIINVILLCVAILLCNATVGGGLIALFKLKADSDSLTACSVLASLVHGIALAISPNFSVPAQNLYFSVGILALTLNTVGKLSMVNRIIRNFKFMSEESPSCVLSPLTDKNIAKNLSGKSDSSSYNIAYCSENEFFSNFLELSYGDDFADSLCHTVSPLILAATLLISALTLVISSNILSALTCLSALLAAAAPFTSTLAANLPFASASKNLLSYGATINGFEAIDTFEAIDCVMLDAADIFTKESVVLHGIKTFSKVRIDEAIVDAASVITKTKSALYGTFDKVIAGNTAMLKEVDSLVYEDGMGLSAWVNSQRVLIGNRTLMMNHGIDVPSTDFETRNVAPNQNVLYLSNSGELTAMFILEYKASADALSAFKNFKENGISIVVNSSDPNITPELISKLFDFPEDMINVIPANLHRDFNTLTAKKKSAKGFAAYDGKISLTSKILSDSAGIKKRVSALLLMQIISIFISCAFITFFAFSGNLNNIGYLLIIIYQLFWTACSFLISIVGWK